MTGAGEAQERASRAIPILSAATAQKPVRNCRHRSLLNETKNRIPGPNTLTTPINISVSMGSIMLWYRIAFAE